MRSPERLTVAMIGDPQYGIPFGTDPQPALDNSILTFEDLKTVPRDFFVVLGDIIQPNNMFWRYHHEYTVGMATRSLYLNWWQYRMWAESIPDRIWGET